MTRDIPVFRSRPTRTQGGNVFGVSDDEKFDTCDACGCWTARLINQTKDNMMTSKDSVHIYKMGLPSWS